MSAGRYRTAVVLHRPVRTDAPDGSAALVFEPEVDTFAEIRLAGQRERVADERLDGVATHQIRLRPHGGVAAGWRIAAPGRLFRILSVADPDQRGRVLVCLAEEETS